MKLQPQEIHEQQVKEIWERLAKEAAENPDWELFAKGLHEKAQGNRKKFTEYIKEFVEQLKASGFESRRDFVAWYLEQCETVLNEFRINLSAYYLYRALIPITLDEWVEKEPSNPLAWYRHAGLRQDTKELKTAYQLDPNNQKYLKVLIIWKINDLATCTHDFPYHYLGNPLNTLKEIVEVENLVAKISNEQKQLEFTEKLELIREATENWVAYKAAKDTDFKVWCSKNNRKYLGSLKWY